MHFFLKLFGHVKKKQYLCSVIQKNHKCEHCKLLEFKSFRYFTHCRLDLFHK